jgi:hypothetical protein
MKKDRIGRLFLFIALALAVLMTLVACLNQAQARGSFPTAPNASVIYIPSVHRSGHAWLQFNFDSRHSGNNTLETSISIDNVNTLALLFQVALPAVADGAPAYLSSVSTPIGIRDLVFLTTTDERILARDAHTGATVWDKQHGPGSCHINNGPSICYTTSSPAIDPNEMFVYSYGLDGYAHKYAVGDGTEITTGGWPELTSLKPYDEKGSPALSIATARNGTSYLYMANGGYPGDAGNYQGHITAINLSDGSQKVFNAMCSNQPVHFVDSRTTTGPDCYPDVQSAIWARPGVVYDPDLDKIYMSTGNGTFNPASFLWGDTVFALHPDGSGDASGNPVDTYTPTNYQSLQNADLDIGSTAPAILPPSAGKYPHLAVQSGKDAVIRLINLDLPGGQAGTGHTGGEVFSMSVPMGGQVLTQPAVWTNPADGSTWVFISNGSGLAGLQLNVDGNGNPSLVSRWTKGAGTSPILANGVLFYVRSGLILALNPVNGTQLWSDNRIGSIHWESPIVANGVLYVTDSSGHLTAYTLP